MTEYEARRDKLLEYHRRQYRDNPEYFKARSREWYALNGERRKEKLRLKHAATYRKRYRITVIDPDGLELQFDYLTEACRKFELPYKTVMVKCYPFEYRGYKFIRNKTKQP